MSSSSSNYSNVRKSSDEKSAPYQPHVSDNPVNVASGPDRDMDKAQRQDMYERESGSFTQLIRKILYTLLWPRLILNHLDIPSLKVILRSWLLMWSLTLLCICGGTIEFMGPSSFLSTFAAGIEIAGNLSVPAAFMIGMADILSVLFACLVSVITLAIGWRIRGYPSENDIISDLQNHGFCNNLTTMPSFDNCILPTMHQGYFLDSKVTVVTIFGMLFSFTICGYFQSVSKYGKLAWLLNSLYTIIVFPFNNMMPVWRPWFYARNCVVPMGMAFATRFAVSLLIFPFSSHFKVVSSLSMACKKLSEISEKIQNLSNTTQPSANGFANNFLFIGSETQQVFSKFIINEMDFELVQRFEVWFSRFEKADLSELRSRVRLVLSALSSFKFFYEAMEDQYLDSIAGPDAFTRKYKLKTGSIKQHRNKLFQKYLENTWKETGEYEFLFKNEFYKRNMEENARYANAVTSRDANKDYREILAFYQPLVLSANETLSSVGKWLASSGGISLLPWNSHESYERDFQDMQHSLSNLIQQIKLSKEKLAATTRVYALHGYVSVHYAERVAGLGRWCSYIYRDRPHAKLVWPFKLGSGTSHEELSRADDFAFDGFHDNIGVALQKVTTSFKPITTVQERNPDSSPPRYAFHLFGIIIEKLRAFFYDDTLLFCVKRAILTVAVEFPYFFKTTAPNAFRDWYLWVAVLTAYTVARQAVDGVYGLLAKLLYTFFGCLVGMVAWYISAGSGHGNPFGYGAVTAFVWLYICYQRQFNNHFAPASSIVYSCTVTLVLGNSWNAGHIVTDGVNLGRGFSVAWIRFVTVAIGLTVAFLGTVFPQLYTAKRAVREIVGSSLEHIGDLQSSISNFAVQRYQVPGTNIIAHTDSITKEARAIITNLNSAETLRKRLIYEPPLSGVYPSHRYKLLISYVNEIALLYSLSYSFLDDVPDTSKMPHILHSMGWTDSRLSTGTYTVLYMCCRALYDAKALPSITPGSLYEQYIFDVLPETGRTIMDYETNGSVDPTTTIAVSLSSQLYRRLDGVVLLIKDLVGEVYDVNMDLFHLE